MLAVAKEKGFFAKYGLDVVLSKEASWANIRDKVSVGALDGAHMLAGMPIASTLGLGAVKQPMITAFSMDLNGNAITVSNKLFERMKNADPDGMRRRPISASPLKAVIAENKRLGAEPLTFAVVFPYSPQGYELRYWLGSAGIDPNNDIRLIVIPPPQMVDNMRAGHIDGYCVGEPWNEHAVGMGIGKTLITKYEIWNNSPEKVFGVTREWADRYPGTHNAVVSALIEAAQWIDQAEHRAEVVAILSGRNYVNADIDVMKMSMTGTFQFEPDADPVPLPDFNVFFRYAATFPWYSHAVWFITQMYRWGHLSVPVDIRTLAEQVYRPDIYREAAVELQIPYPTIGYKTEGTKSGCWQLSDATRPILMGEDRFFDGGCFDPDHVVDYIAAFAVKNIQVDLEELAALNRPSRQFAR